MDTSLEGLKQGAFNATQDVANLQSSAPSLLQSLRQNLVSIFAKDNPVMKARDVALSDYLSTPARARADYLPYNMPQIEGRPLALSPTQQDAITTSRSAAALAPLFGLNEIIRNQYGSIGDIVENAATLYNSQVEAGKTRSSGLLDLYKTGVAEQEAKTKASEGVGLGDISSILSLLGESQQTQVPSLDDIFASTQKKQTQAKKKEEPNFLQKIMAAIFPAQQQPFDPYTLKPVVQKAPQNTLLNQLDTLFPSSGNALYGTGGY